MTNRERAEKLYIKIIRALEDSKEVLPIMALPHNKRAANVIEQALNEAQEEVKDKLRTTDKKCSECGGPYAFYEKGIGQAIEEGEG